MPISKRLFELGIDEETADKMTKADKFLTEHKDEAFTISELADVIYGKYQSTEKTNTLFYALKILVDNEVVQSRLIRGTTYYSHGLKKLAL